MTRPRNCAIALLATAAALLTASPARAAGSWQTNYAFGASLKGDLYTPSAPAASPAILVAIHMCSGHSSTVHGWFDSFADQSGFYIIAPDAGKNCFDASASRTGDKAAVVAMVQNIVTNKHADASRVFAAGMSSGGCMTNTLLAVYPDVFAGGSYGFHSESDRFYVTTLSPPLDLAIQDFAAEPAGADRSPLSEVGADDGSLDRDGARDELGGVRAGG